MKSGRKAMPRPNNGNARTNKLGTAFDATPNPTQFSLKETGSVTRNRRYCPQCGKSKFCFDSKKSADLYLLYNADAIRDEHGYAPVRSYYCPVCGCWHVTSMPLCKLSKKVSGQEILITPTMRHKAQRQVDKVEHCILAAFKALCYNDLTQAKVLCSKGLDLYIECLGMAVRGDKLAQLFYQLDLCATRCKELSDKLKKRLFKIDYQTDRIFNHQWYDMKEAS